MSRVLLWITGGLVLGGIIHLAVILTLPTVATNDLWDRISEMTEPGEVMLLDATDPGERNLLQLDPELVYALCRFDLSQGPGVMEGELPLDFWSLGIFDSNGVAVYSTTNRAGVGRTLQLGLFNINQTRLLAEQQFEIEQGMLIVESPANLVFAVVRLAPPHPAMHARYKTGLESIGCGHIDIPDAISESPDPS